MELDILRDYLRIVSNEYEIRDVRNIKIIDANTIRILTHTEGSDYSKSTEFYTDRNGNIREGKSICLKENNNE